MKIKLQFFIFAMVVVLFLAGASMSEPSSAMRAYMEVFKNNAGFYMCETSYVGDQAIRRYQGKHTLLRELLSDDSDSDYAGRAVEQFAVVDMDGNGVPEVVIELSRDGERIVFHYKDGKIYGFGFSYRGMNESKKDGTFTGSSGADSSSIDRLEFLDDVCKVKVLA